ncbi:phage tail tube protein [Modicisalibacter coralii]|uniref:phage tail tube protein n=1 Tax=Modicisalibacter coralii TaxID=2304602 RepID=UPI00100B3D69|nr:phage tail tube protein [Halomonas coralii]
MSESNRVRIAIRPDGSSSNWKTLRRTNDALTAGTNTTRSENVRSDRMRDGQKITTITVGGTLNIEMTAAEYDDLIAAAMCSTWTADTPTAGTDQITVGTTTTKFEVLKSYLDEDRHILMSGMEVGQLELNMDSGSKITGTVTFMGTQEDHEYDPSTDTFDPASDALFFDSSNNLSSVTIDGSPLSGIAITGMSMTINNNHQTDQELGTQYQTHHKGSADITTSKTVRMSASAFDLWKNTLTNTPIATSFTMGDGSNSYVFSQGREFLSGDAPSGGLDAILTFTLNGVSAVDATGEMLTIERTLAP